MTCIFHGRLSILDVSIFMLPSRCNSLDTDTLCCVFFCEWLVRAAWSGDKVKMTWQVWGIVRVSSCVAGAALSEDLSCVECHFARHAQYLGHTRLYILLHFTLFAVHLTLHTLRVTMYR